MAKGLSYLYDFIFYTFVVPDPLVATLLNSGTSLANTPKCFWDGGRFVKVEFWEILLNGICGCLSLVVWDGRIKVVCDVRCSNLVVQEVNQSPGVKLIVWSINCVQGAFYVAVVLVREVRNINIGMLKPSKVVEKRRQIGQFSEISMLNPS